MATSTENKDFFCFACSTLSFSFTPTNSTRLNEESTVDYINFRVADIKLLARCYFMLDNIYEAIQKFCNARREKF